MSGRRVFLSLLLFWMVCFLFVAHGQVLRSQSEPVGNLTYGDLTEREHCVQNLVLSWQDRNIERFETLLHAKYEVIFSDGQRLNREVAIKATKTFFDAVSKVNVEIGKGEWTGIDSESGAPCPGCWETIRDLSYTVVPINGERPETHKQKIRLVVAPSEEKGIARYRIRVFEHL